MVDAGFPRSARLLTARDFKHVFDDAPYRAASQEVLVLARSNDDGCSRLGIVVGKKNCRRAHRRNRFKRLVRESFRVRKQELAGLDIVVLARKGITSLDNETLNALLASLWKRVLKKAAQSPTC